MCWPYTDYWLVKIDFDIVKIAKAAHAITSERNNMNKNHVLALIFVNALKFAKFANLKDL